MNTLTKLDVLFLTPGIKERTTPSGPCLEGQQTMAMPTLRSALQVRIFLMSTLTGINNPIAWSARFPRSTPDPNALPKEWLDALAAVEAAGKIPNIPITSGKPNENPVYPPGVNPNSPAVCSSTYKCRIPGDIWDGPDGVFATSFDDGPQPVSGFFFPP